MLNPIRQVLLLCSLYVISVFLTMRAHCVFTDMWLRWFFFLDYNIIKINIVLSHTSMFPFMYLAMYSEKWELMSLTLNSLATSLVQYFFKALQCVCDKLSRKAGHNNFFSVHDKVRFFFTSHFLITVVLSSTSVLSTKLATKQQIWETTTCRQRFCFVNIMYYFEKERIHKK